MAVNRTGATVGWTLNIYWSDYGIWTRPRNMTFHAYREPVREEIRNSIQGTIL